MDDDDDFERMRERIAALAAWNGEAMEQEITTTNQQNGAGNVDTDALEGVATAPAVGDSAPTPTTEIETIEEKPMLTEAKAAFTKAKTTITKAMAARGVAKARESADAARATFDLASKAREAAEQTLTIADETFHTATAGKSADSAWSARIKAADAFARADVIYNRRRKEHEAADAALVAALGEQSEVQNRGDYEAALAESRDDVLFAEAAKVAELHAAWMQMQAKAVGADFAMKRRHAAAIERAIELGAALGIPAEETDAELRKNREGMASRMMMGVLHDGYARDAGELDTFVIARRDAILAEGVERPASVARRAATQAVEPFEPVFAPTIQEGSREPRTFTLDGGPPRLPDRAAQAADGGQF